MTQDDKKIVALCGGVGGAKLAYGLSRSARRQAQRRRQYRAMTSSISACRCHPTWIRWSIRLANSPMRSAAGAGQARAGTSGRAWWARRRNLVRGSAIAISRCTSFARARCAPASSLTDFTRELAQRLNIAAAILPMTDDPFATMIVTADERMAVPALLWRRAGAAGRQAK